MKGQVWMLLVFMVMIGMISIIFMAMTVPLGWVYEVSQTVTPTINNTEIEGNISATQDQIWNQWWMVPTAFLIILIIWAYAHSQRKESGSEYVMVR